MSDFEIAVLLPPSYHEIWRNALIKSLSPVETEGKTKGIDIAEWRVYHVRAYNQDDKLLLSKFKTYNNLDHTGGEHRAWVPWKNHVIRFFRAGIGLGVVPLTESHPINTPGHVFVLATKKNRVAHDGREMR